MQTLTSWYYCSPCSDQLVLRYVRHVDRYPAHTCITSPGHLTARRCLLGHVASFKFQETFFFPPQNKTRPCPASSRLLLAKSVDCHALIGQSEDMSAHVTLKQHPPSLNSSVCNWYRPRRKNTRNFTIFQWEKKLRRSQQIKVSVIKTSRRTTRRLGLFFSQVTSL